MSIDTVIVASGLTKTYGDVLAVDRLDLAVKRGEIYGFLGRNGAGKTTTIRMLLGLVKPTAGAASLFGTPIVRGEQSVFMRVGYLVEAAASYSSLTVRENLDIQRRLTGSPRHAVHDAIGRLGLDSYADRRAGWLSLGNKQRLALARAVLHHPDVLLLDEPANGLDPAGIVEVREFLRTLADEQGLTVLLSSHILTEVAHLADRIGVIHNGRLLEDLSRDELRARSRPYLDVRVSDVETATVVLAERLNMTHVQREASGDVLRVFESSERVPDIARVLVGAGLDVMALCPAAEALEEHFMKLTGGQA